MLNKEEQTYEQAIADLRPTFKDTKEQEAAMPTLLEAAEEILRDFNVFGEILQLGDNGEYGTESAIGQLAAAIEREKSKS